MSTWHLGDHPGDNWCVVRDEEDAFVQRHATTSLAIRAIAANNDPEHVIAKAVDEIMAETPSTKG